MDELKMLGQNYILTVALSSWLVAQVIKVVLTFVTQKQVVWERLVGAGGMPSSHSALVCSMTVGMARKVGLGSPEFALAFLLAAIVMYDAMGVRRAAGEHAKVLNQMMSFFNKKDRPWLSPAEDEKQEEESCVSSDKLKEFLGHTPLEVLAGALLGILIAMAIPTF